jgi:hypothetical protein
VLAAGTRAAQTDSLPGFGRRKSLFVRLRALPRLETIAVCRQSSALHSLPAWFFEDRISNSFEAVYGLVHLAKLCFQVFDGLFMVQDDLRMFEVLSHGIFYPGKCYQHRLKFT